MNLRLASPEDGWTMEMQVDLGECPFPGPWRVWLEDYKSCLQERFLTTLGRHLPGVLLEALDPEFRRPTDENLRCAVDIAIALGVSLPREALRFDYAAQEFIDAHSERLKALRGPERREGNGEPPGK